MAVFSRVVCQFVRADFPQRSATLWNSLLSQGRHSRHLLLPSRGFRQRQKLRRDDQIGITPAHQYDKQNGVIFGFMKSALFTAGFCSSSFVVATIWQHESLSQRNNQNILEWAKVRWNDLHGWESKNIGFRQEVNKWWNSLPDGHKIFWPICFVNMLVFLAWKNPAFHAAMLNYFCSSPYAKAVCSPLFLAMFSHFSLFHIGLNMYALHTMSPLIFHELGKEQYVALYLSGGVFASLCSNLYKVVLNSPRPSLGASGAILTFIGYFCTQVPDCQMSIIFLPDFKFSGETGLKAAIALSIVAAALGWHGLDHAAHVGGALFGVAYAKYGTSGLWDQRYVVVKHWQQLKQKVKQRLKSADE